MFALTDFQVDDSWITYRYADNIASGLGFVYNPGERVYGTTTPLLTLLLALAARLGAPAPWAALAINLVASAGLLAAAAWLLRSLVEARWLALGLWALALAPTQIVWSVSGMETALFTAFLVLGFAAYVERAVVPLAVVAAGLFLTRFDGLVFWLAVPTAELLLLAARRWRLYEPSRAMSLGAHAKTLALAVLLVAPWLAFALWYFHDAVPNSVWAKLALYNVAGFDRTAPIAVVGGILRLSTFGPWFVEIPLAAAVLVATLWRPSRLLVLPVFVLGYMAFLLLGRTHVHTWYLAPAHAAMLLMAVPVLARWIERARWPAPAWTAAALALALALAGPYRAWAEAAERQLDYARAHADIGHYVALRAGTGDTVYAWDIGYIGYLTGLRILDFVGIVSPEVMAYNKRRDYLGVLQRYEPEWAVVGLYGDAYRPIIDSAWFRERYEEVYRNVIPELAPWAEDDPRRLRRYRPEYIVYRRRS